MSIIGAVAAYRANGGASGVHFANRYFSVGFVLGIRFLSLIIAAGVFIACSVWAFDLEAPIPVTFLEVMLLSLLVAYYWRLARHIHDVAGP